MRDQVSGLLKPLVTLVSKDAFYMALLLLPVYLLTMPGTVLIEDSTLFITAAYHWGYPQPPGYPLYTLLCKLFISIPIGSIPVRVYFLNSLLAVASCILFYYIANKTLKNRLVAFTGGLVYGFCATFWWQAIISEVYTLNAFFFLLLFYLALKLREDFNYRGLYWFTFLFGLSLSNHWPLMVLSSPCFVFLLKSHFKKIVLVWYKVLPLSLLGLLPYLYIPISYSFDPEIAFLPVEGLKDLWNYFLRKDFANVDYQETTTFTDKVKYILFFFRNFLHEFYFPGILLLPVGIYLSFKKLSKEIAFAILLSFLSSSILLKFFLHFNYDYLHLEAYQSYLLIPLWGASFYIIIALNFLIRRFLGETKAYIKAIPCIFLVAAIVGSNFSKNDLRDETFVYDYAKEAMRLLPPESILFTRGSTEVFAYLQTIENFRKDIKLYHENGIFYKNRIFPLNRLRSREMISRLKNFVDREDNIFALELGLFQNLRDTPQKKNGLFWELGDHSVQVDLQPASLSMAKKLLDKVQPNQQWKWDYYMNAVVRNLCEVVVQAKEPHPIFNWHHNCQYILALDLHNRGNFQSAYFELAYKIFHDLIKNRRADSLKSEVDDLYHRYLISKGIWLDQQKTPPQLKQQQVQSLVNEALASLDVYPHCRNKVLQELLMQKARGRELKLPMDKLTKSFGHCAKRLQKEREEF